MKKLQTTFFLLLFIQISFGQKLDLINNQALQFSIKKEKDTINFILIDTKLDEIKPIFLFCQGSLPMQKNPMNLIKNM